MLVVCMVTPLAKAIHIGNHIAQDGHQQLVGPTRIAQPQALCICGWTCDWNEGSATVRVKIEGCQGGREGTVGLS